MNSIQKLAHIPTKLASAIKYPIEIGSSRRLGCAHVAAKLNLYHELHNPLEVEVEQIVQLSSPVELKEVMCTDKYFAEKRGNQIITFAATKKLLAEEKLRKTLNEFKVPLDNIMRENKRQKPVIRPLCPVIHEEL